MALGQYSGGIGAIAGAIIGGVIGYQFGMTQQGAMIGASLGGMAGGVAGSVLWPEKVNPDFPPPPQPNENRTQISTYGTPIPVVYESARLAGNIIYMSDVNNTVVRTSHRQDGVRYYELTQTYASTFAVAFCEGPVSGISRIWLNGKIFVDWRNPASQYYPEGSEGVSSGNLETSVGRSVIDFKTYTGTASQTYDTNIAAIIGAAETPAYRGICYIVFIDFPVGEFSGVPTVEVEISGAIGNVQLTDMTALSTGYAGGKFTTTTTSATINYLSTDGSSYYLYRSLTFDSTASGTVWWFTLTINSLGGPETGSPDSVNLFRALIGASVADMAKFFFQEPEPSQSFYLGLNTQATAINYTNSLPFTRYFTITHTKDTGVIKLDIHSDSNRSVLEHTETKIHGVTGVNISYFEILSPVDFVNNNAFNFTMSNLMYGTF